MSLILFYDLLPDRKPENKHRQLANKNVTPRNASFARAVDGNTFGRDEQACINKTLCHVFCRILLTMRSGSTMPQIAGPETMTNKKNK